MKKLIIVIFVLISTISIAQQKDTLRYSSFTNNIETPFNPVGNKNTYAIKARVLPYLIGNGSGLSTLLGTEIGFFKRHSIGVDGVFRFGHDVEDQVKDLQGNYHESGNQSHDNERAIVFDYRYYFNLQKFRRQKGFSFYTSCFYKIGNLKNTKDPNFKNPFITETDDYISFGIVLGSIMNFTNSERFGIDFNIGVFQKDKNRFTEYLVDSMLKTKAEKLTETGIRIGLTIDYYIFVKTKHKQI